MFESPQKATMEDLTACWNAMYTLQGMLFPDKDASFSQIIREVEKLQTRIETASDSFKEALSLLKELSESIDEFQQNH